MSSSSSSTVKFWVLATGTIIASAGLLALGWVATRPYRTNQANHYVQMGERGTGDLAQLNYRLAYALNSQNQAAATAVAESELAAGNPESAVKIMQSVVDGQKGRGLSAAFTATQLRALLETGPTAAAASLAHTLDAQPNLTDSEITMAAFGLQATGQGSDATALQARVSAPQAAGRIRAAMADNVSLASEMIASGLPRAAQRILEATPSTPPRDLLLAKLLSPSKAKTDHTKAASLYASYLSAQPADVAVRVEYASLLNKLKRNTEANHQLSLAASLKAGQP